MSVRQDAAEMWHLWISAPGQLFAMCPIVGWMALVQTEDTWDNDEGEDEVIQTPNNEVRQRANHTADLPSSEQERHTSQSMKRNIALPKYIQHLVSSL